MHTITDKKKIKFVKKYNDNVTFNYRLMLLIHYFSNKKNYYVKCNVMEAAWATEKF